MLSWTASGIVGLFLLLSMFGLAAYGDALLVTPKRVSATEDSVSVYQILPAEIDLPVIKAKHWLLFDARTKAIMAGQADQQSVPIASLTKLMTALISREYVTDSELLTVPAVATQQIGSSMGLEQGETISALAVLSGLLIKSGNDAAYTLAQNYPGGLDAFVARMNQRAIELGLNTSRFTEPSGLDDIGYSTARDLAQLAMLVMNDSVLQKIISQSEMNVADQSGRIIHPLKNSNRLLNDLPYPGAIGVKTGYTPEAGHLLVAAAKRNGRQLIAVIMHTDDDTKSASAVEAIKLLDWGFARE